MLTAAVGTSEPEWMQAAAATMWDLVRKHTGHVGYRMGLKATGLLQQPPEIDCSGWVGVLLTAGMRAANDAGMPNAFTTVQFDEVQSWSDRIIDRTARRSGIIEGRMLRLDSLPLLATIGTQQGGGKWASNHPRRRGITHIVQVVRRPTDGLRFVSESQGMDLPYGVRLTPLAHWVEVHRKSLDRGAAWAVDCFGAAHVASELN